MEFEGDWAVVRGRRYARDTIQGAPLPSPKPVPEGRRFGPSAISFGLPGRIVCTLLALTPVLRFAATGSVLWFVVAAGSLPMGVWFLRDTWRRNR